MGMPGMVKKAKDTIKKYPNVRAFMFECTEMPPYADAIRHATGMPVYDSITSCNSFMSGLLDNTRFGLVGWQKEWDGTQEDYKFGQHLCAAEKEKLQTRSFHERV